MFSGDVHKLACDQNERSSKTKGCGSREASTAVDHVDIVLLGPQVRFQKATVEKLVKGRIPVEVMDMRLYGTMNGKAILEDALQKMN